MSNERVTYVELNVSKDSRNQKRQPRGTRSSISVTEQEITYVEFSFQNTSPDHPSVCRDCCCKGFPSPPEKLITVILGVIGFALFVAVVLITTVFSSYPKEKEQINLSKSGPQKGQLCHCPKEWMSYSHNFYYISVEKKNWTDSFVSCNAKNSSLLYIESEEEQEGVSVTPSKTVACYMAICTHGIPNTSSCTGVLQQNFLQSLSLITWIGVFRESRDQPWVWGKDSTFKPKITELSHGEHNCVMLSTSGLPADDCAVLHTYLCKHKLTN